MDKIFGLFVRVPVVWILFGSLLEGENALIKDLSKKKLPV
jgi:hypothetical protein